MSIEINEEEVEQTGSTGRRTRPVQVTRHTDRAQARRNVTRLTVDLSREQHNFLRLFTASNGTKSAVVIRALLFQLEVDRDFADHILDIIFSDPSEEEEASEE